MGRKVNTAQTNFTAGALSPLMAARYDNQNFENGAQQLVNLQPLAQGGARTRPGSVYQATIPEQEGVLESFVFDNDQRYVFVFTNGKVQIFQKQSAGYVFVGDITSAPWSKATLARQTVTHFGDTMIVFHGDVRPQIITRTGATTFARADFTFEASASGAQIYQPYYKFAPSVVTLQPSATTGTITMTLSGVGGFDAAHVGQVVRYKGKEILVTAVASANSATGTVRETLDGTDADADWDEPVFSDFRGWPNSGEFHEDRLWLFGSRSRRTGRWFSKLGAYFNFDLGTVEANEASWEAIGGDQISEGLYAVSHRHMLLFADSGVFYQPATPTNPITPDSAASPRQARIGCTNFKPFVYDDAVVFCTNHGRTICAARYNDVDQAYAVNPISLLSPHLVDTPTDGGAVLDSSDRTEQYAFFVNGDGRLSLLHSQQQESLLAMTPWETAGTYKAIRAVGEDLVCLVERQIAGSTVWTLECFEESAAPMDACKCVDNGTPTKTFSGFGHLAGQTVTVWSQGHDLGDYTVAVDGTITLGELDPEVSVIEAGLAFSQVLQPMPAVFNLPASGPTRGDVLGLVSLTLEIDQSAHFQVNGNTVALRFAGDAFDQAAPTKTGPVKVYMQGYDKDAAPEIRINRPAKVTILGLNREVEVNT